MNEDLQKKIDKLKSRKKENRIEIIKKRLSGKNIKKYRYYFIGFVFLFFFLLLFLIFKPIIGKSWLEYPLPLRAEIAWSRWQASYSSDCHSTCLNERAAMAEIIARAWSVNQQYWDKKIFEFLKDSDSLLKQKSLVDLSLKVYSSHTAPYFLRDIVYSSEFNYNLKHFIISRFALSFSSDKSLFIHLASEVAEQSLSLDQRRSAILAMHPWLNREALDFCLNVLFSAEGPILKIAALELLSIWPIEKTPLTEFDLERLANLALDKNLSLELRPRLVWLISDYYLLYPQSVIFWLKEIYNQENLDVFSRGFAADYLNRISDYSLALPDTNQADWEKYYSIY